MPVPKGKQRRKPRNRIRRELSSAPVESTPIPTAKSRGSRSARPARRQTPMWLNITLGVIMVVAGTFFTVVSPGGLGTVARIILLLGYFIIAGYYFGKAYRQYRRRTAV